MEKIKRIYHPYYNWEEINYNMWGTVSNKNHWVNKAIDFTGDHKKYGSFMIRVAEEWTISCENALTDYFLNRRAWIGHAAVALAMNCPEYITREAWSYLNYEQQLLADEEAERAIRAWEYSKIKGGSIRYHLGKPMLL